MMGSFIRHGLGQEDVVSETLMQMFVMKSPSPASRALAHPPQLYGTTSAQSEFQHPLTPHSPHSVAGADTTATAIRATLLHIITNPHAYTTLQSEIDAAERTGRISFPVIRDSEARALP